MEFGATGKSESAFIIKPDAGCQGKGIFLTKKVKRKPEPHPALHVSTAIVLRVRVVVTIHANKQRSNFILFLCTAERGRKTTELFVWWQIVTAL